MRLGNECGLQSGLTAESHERKIGNNHSIVGVTYLGIFLFNYFGRWLFPVSRF